MQKELITNFCNTWLEILYPLKDTEFQRRSWFRLEGTEVSTFEEATASLLDHYDIMIKPRSPEFQQFNDREFFDLIKQLYEKVNACTRDNDFIIRNLHEEKLLNDPQWLEIVSLAQKICNVLNRRIQEVENEK
jgi:hypothetical protein